VTHLRIGLTRGKGVEELTIQPGKERSILIWYTPALSDATDGADGGGGGSSVGAFVSGGASAAAAAAEPTGRGEDEAEVYMYM